MRLGGPATTYYKNLPVELLRVSHLDSTVQYQCCIIHKHILALLPWECHGFYLALVSCTRVYEGFWCPLHNAKC